MADLIEIDGTFGEGGGQILRTSLALSMLTGKPFRIRRIRGRRRKPGLRRQHLTGVHAAKAVSNARVQGARLNSADLTFEPGEVSGGVYRFDVKTAGSAMLVLQTVLPPLFCADRPSTVTVLGGTHNPMSPPYDFFAETFLPAVNRMGFRALSKLSRYGFAPAGGGKVVVQVESARERGPHDFGDQRGAVKLGGRIYIAKLPERIWQAERRALMELNPRPGRVEQRKIDDSPGPGNCVVIVADRGSGVRAQRTILASFGRPGKPAKEVVEEAADYCREVVESRAVADRFLTDQLLIYLAIVGGGSFTAPRMTRHATTNMAIIEKFLPVRWVCDEKPEHCIIRCLQTKKFDL